MPSCALRYCSNNSRNISKSQGVTFHQFPGPRHEKIESWIRFVRMNRREETWLPSDYTRICSLHFKYEDKYVTKTGRVYLRKSAVPCDDPLKCEPSEVTDPLYNPSISSSNPIFDSPSEIVLKNKLRKESAARKILNQKCKKIVQQNIYFKNRCAYYKSIIQKMLEKPSVNLNAIKTEVTIKTEVVEPHES